MSDTPLMSLPEILARGRAAFMAWIGMPEPLIADLFAREGYDLVALDRQHGAIDDMAMVRGVQAVVGCGVPAVVRIPVGEFATASRALDAGASAVIAPMVNTLDDARRFAAAMKLPPLGERSWGPYRALAYAGLTPAQYLVEANGFSLAIAMIETREALAIVDEILATPGIDGVFVGPSDLSIALSNGAAFDPASPAVDAALAHVLRQARAAGKSAWVYAVSPERAHQMAQTGYDVVAVSGDGPLIKDAARRALAIARGRPG